MGNKLTLSAIEFVFRNSIFQKIIKYKNRSFRRVRKQAKRTKRFAKLLNQKGIDPADSDGDSGDE